MNTDKNMRPPKWADRLLAWYCGNAPIDDLHGDIEELFYADLKTMSPGKARLRYWQQVLSLIFSYAIKKRKARVAHHPYSHTSISFAMIRSYFTVGLRAMLRNKTYSAINITGLSIGLACCLLLILYTKDELSYDHFHVQGSNIYQLTCDRVETSGQSKKFAIAAMVQGPAFAREIPEIKSLVRTKTQPTIIRKGTEIFDDQVQWVDDGFFDVFSFPLLTGHASSVLHELHSVVITPDVAARYFGTEDPMGKSLDIQVDGEFETFVVSGIARPSPANSTIKFRILLPFRYLEEIHPDNGWHWVSFQTYFLLNPGADPAAIKSKMTKVYETQAKTEIDEMRSMGYGDRFVWGLQPFESMHLNTEYEGVPEASDPLYSYVLLGIALFILLIACINFINIAIAQSLSRSKEIGVRKVIGGQRIQLIGQFLGESFLLCLLSFVLAILLAQLALPMFNVVAEKQLSLTYLWDTNLVTGLCLLLLATSLVSGFYPAMVLSSLNPIKSLYNKVSFSAHYLSRSLVVVQFALATTLIIATLFMHEQFSFLTKKELGYNDKNLLEITIEKAIMDKQLTRRLKTEFSRVPGVEMVAPRNVGRFLRPVKAGGKEFPAVYEHVDEDYFTTLQIPVVAGRAFSKDYPADSISGVVVNQAFVNEVGWDDPIGKTIDYMDIPGWGDKKLTIVGVTKDYHFESLKEKIKPQVFTYESRLPLGVFLVRIKPDNIPSTLTALETTFRKDAPFDSFQYTFKDDSNREMYRAEARWKQIITLGAILTVFISGIGLFGLTALSTKRRTKEIGIRKMLGASSATIMSTISLDFIKLIFISFIISIPLVSYGLSVWLNNFAYRIDFNVHTYAFAALLSVAIAMISIGAQVAKAAIANPIESLNQD
ncbi:MAG TPA: ABC transporter permease [Cyclobacteriaceae bacterium]|nr:antibiotic ABC transporter permease [Cytophagales bacterium]HNP78480.1 ABC transporter permease [Cyclobacteriaceae bacterium]